MQQPMYNASANGGDPLTVAAFSHLLASCLRLELEKPAMSLQSHRLTITQHLELTEIGSQHRPSTIKACSRMDENFLRKSYSGQHGFQHGAQCKLLVRGLELQQR